MKNVLLVEDSIDDQELTRRAMSQTSIERNRHVAADGLEALAYVQ